MKKLFVISAMVFFASVLAAPAFCANATVDIERILMEYNKARETNLQFERQNQQLKSYIINAQKQVEEAKTPVEKKTLEDKFRAEIKNRSENLKNQQLQKVSALEKEIYQVIDKVSAGKYEMVFVKNMVVRGGVDITTEVINKLNASGK